MPTRSVRWQVRRNTEKRGPGRRLAVGVLFHLEATRLVESGCLQSRIIDWGRLSAQFHSGTESVLLVGAFADRDQELAGLFTANSIDA
jgi:hypothetical protein